MERRGSRKRARAAWLLAALGTLATRAASAQSAAEDGEARVALRLELEWTAPSECSERTRTLESVERLLGASPRGHATTLLAASASVTRTASGSFHLSLDVRHETELLTRKLEASSCAELVEAAALILALALDPELQSRGSPGTLAPQSVAQDGEPRLLPSAERARASFAPRAATPAPGEPRPRSHGARRVAFIELGPVTSWGVIPMPAFGASLSGGLEFGQLRLVVTGAYFPSARHELSGTRAAAVFELRTLCATLCWLLPVSDRWAFGPCGTTEFGSIAAHGEGVELPRDTTKRWGATGLGGVLRFASPRAVEFGLHSALAVPWGRPSFRVAGAEVYEPKVLNLGLRAFAGVRF